MRDLGRGIYNTLFRSAHWFNDDMTLFDNIRVTAFAVLRIFPFIYDPAKRLSRVDSAAIWRWRDSRIPLEDWSDSGPELSEAEKLDLYQKRRVFVAKQPRRFEPLR